jgi:hypothetical protein
MKKINRGVSKVNKNISKANPASYAMKNKKVVNTMGDIGKYTRNKILPGVVSTAIPVVSNGIGALATVYGGPMAGEMASNLSSNLMEQYIPGKYQSDNKYIGMLGDAINMGMSGEIDPMQASMMGQELMGNISKDLGPKNKTNNYNTRPNIIPNYNINRPRFDNENPYLSMMQQMQPQMPLQEQEQDPNAKNDAMYKNAKIGKGADSIINKISPYQQKEGSMSGLLGGGMRNKKYTKLIQKVEIIKKPTRKRKNKKNNNYEEKTQKVEIIEKPRHKKFTHAKNLALDQLIEANEYKNKKRGNEKMDDYLEKQIRMLRAEGY